MMKIIAEHNNPTTFSSEVMSRYIQIGEWFFEVKNIRALRVDQYGKPYDAIASICVNGDNANIDGLLTFEDNNFTQQDYLTFMSFCQQLGMESVNFDGFTPATHEERLCV